MAKTWKEMSKEERKSSGLTKKEYNRKNGFGKQGEIAARQEAKSRAQSRQSETAAQPQVAAVSAATQGKAPVQSTSQTTTKSQGTITAPAWYRNSDGSTPSTMSEGMTQEKWQSQNAKATAGRANEAAASQRKLESNLDYQKMQRSGMADKARAAGFDPTEYIGNRGGLARDLKDVERTNELNNQRDFERARDEMKASTGKSNLGMDAVRELSLKHLGYDTTASSRRYLRETKTKDSEWDNPNVTYGANSDNPLTYERRMAMDPNHGKVGDDPRALAAQARAHTAYKNETAKQSEANERTSSFENDYGYTPRFDLTREQRAAAEQRGRDSGIF